MLLRSPSNIWLQSGDSLGFEPIRQSHFEIELYNNDGERMLDAGQYTILSVPSISNPSQIVQYGMVNSFFPVPGLKEHGGNVPLVFRATTNTRALEWFLAWRRAVYDPINDFVGLYNKVIGSGKIIPYNPGESGGRNGCPMTPEPTGVVIRLEGIWPTDVMFNEWSMDMEGTPATFQVVFAVTDAYIEKA